MGRNEELALSLVKDVEVVPLVTLLDDDVSWLVRELDRGVDEVAHQALLQVAEEEVVLDGGPDLLLGLLRLEVDDPVQCLLGLVPDAGALGAHGDSPVPERGPVDRVRSREGLHLAHALVRLVLVVQRPQASLDVAQRLVRTILRQVGREELEETPDAEGLVQVGVVIRVLVLDADVDVALRGVGRVSVTKLGSDHLGILVENVIDQELDWVRRPVLEALHEDLLEDGVELLVLDVGLNLVDDVGHLFVSLDGAARSKMDLDSTERAVDAAFLDPDRALGIAFVRLSRQSRRGNASVLSPAGSTRGVLAPFATKHVSLFFGVSRRSVVGAIVE